MNYEWKLKNSNKQDIIKCLLANRGITAEAEIASFLSPDWDRDIFDPMLFKNMAAAVERIFLALEQGEKITIHGDYDADGVCGSALLYDALRDICRALNFNFNVGVFLPHRERDGYGIAAHTIEKLAQDSTRLLITVDCGIAAAAELDQAYEFGIESIVCDHHQLSDRLPAKSIIIHPLLPGSQYPNKQLCGTGVVFKFVTAMINEARSRGASLPAGYEKWFLDLVAIATVTDAVPLLGENRTLEKYGLKVLNKTRRPGIRKIAEFARTPLGTIDSEAIGFRIGPRLNAAGRIESAEIAFKTLVAVESDEASRYALQLEMLNRERQRISDLVYVEARQIALRQRDNNQILVVWNQTWHPGVIGLVAGKLTSEFGLPAFVITNVGEHYIGSGRSVGDFHLVEAIKSCGDIFIKAGGHPQACGITVSDSKVIAIFHERLLKFAKEYYGSSQPKPTLEIDAELAIDQIDWAVFGQIEKLAPFGKGNPKPIFIASHHQILSVQAVGNEKSHLRLLVSNGNQKVAAIGFGLGEWANQLLPGDFIDFVYELSVNEWNGNREIQCRLIDLKMADF